MNRKLYLYQDLLLSWQLMACLIIAMGIGRFIYTPALPLMQDQLHLTSKMGALVDLRIKNLAFIYFLERIKILLNFLSYPILLKE